MLAAVPIFSLSDGECICDGTPIQEQYLIRFDACLNGLVFVPVLVDSLF